eukprot:6032166-Pyramimonas_sp.AAC.1
MHAGRLQLVQLQELLIQPDEDKGKISSEPPQVRGAEIDTNRAATGTMYNPAVGHPDDDIFAAFRGQVRLDCVFRRDNKLLFSYESLYMLDKLPGSDNPSVIALKLSGFKGLGTTQTQPIVFILAPQANYKTAMQQLIDEDKVQTIFRYWSAIRHPLSYPTPDARRPPSR